MSQKLLTEAPLWFVIFCIITALLYSFVLYLRDRRLKEISIYLKTVMGTLRFVAVFIIAFLLLTPVFKNLETTIEKPVIIFAQDNSQSIKLAYNDEQLNQYKQNIANFLKKMEEKYKVQIYSFGEETQTTDSFSFTEKYTSFDDLFDKVQNDFYNKNVGAIIVASDGIYNKGVNPIYLTQEIPCPIYTIGLGDTTIYPDIAITKVRHNKIAFLNNKFPIQVYVEAKKLKNKTFNLKVINQGTEIYSDNFDINSNDFATIIDIEAEAKTVGVQRYTIKITDLPEEKNTANNFKEIAIEIMDSRQKILILANSPHPDISAIQNALKGKESYKVEYFRIDDFTGSLLNYNLVILHQLPSLSNSATKILSELKTKNIPAIFILGAQSSFNNFNTLDLGLKILQASSSYDESTATLNQEFALFEIHEDFAELVSALPPLICPFGTYTKSANLKVLLKQKINSIATENPLISFSTNEANNAAKICFISGEGIWRWRLTDYMKNKSHESFDLLINKIIQYLALKQNKEKFVVTTEKIFQENQNLHFDAEVYNDSYELVNKEDVTLEIKDKDKDNKIYNYIFDKSEKAYFLDIGTFPLGDYTYSAKTVFNNNTLTKSGSFSIIALNTEAENIVANHSTLLSLASQNQGMFYTENQLDSMFVNISDNQNIVPLSYTKQQFTDLLNLKWLFFVILLLLTAEWFLRKYMGAY